MKIATLLFTYARSKHTKQVLEALKKNSEIPQKLFVFQDGKKESTNCAEWQAVNLLINQIDWCNKEIIISESNKGLAKSIVDGINYAFEQYDAVIVLEDDCVPMPGFISFMRQCFEKYEHINQIYSVSGYSWPIELEKDEYDIYFNGRISSWGWGTWKNRWTKYVRDRNMVYRLRHDRDKSIQLDQWGSDLEEMCMDNINGKNDSWAVYWALKVIENNGLCINPYKSLIQNIGMDGTGVHCSETKDYDVVIEKEENTEFIFPEIVNCSYGVKEAFTSLFGSYTALGHYDEKKKNVLIYGVGKYWKRNERLVNEQYNVIGFVDRKKTGWYAGKKIVAPTEISTFEYDYIIVMLYDREECKKIEHDLEERCGIPVKKILVNYYGSENKHWRDKNVRE